MGETSVSSIIREQTIPVGQNAVNDERLCIRLYIFSQHVEQLTEPEDDSTPYYKWKKQVLERESHNLRSKNDPSSGFFIDLSNTFFFLLFLFAT